MKQITPLLIITISLIAAPAKENLISASENKPKAIVIKNCITKDELKIRKMMKWHYPKYFRVLVNGKTIRPNQEIKVPEKKAITVQYDYEWYIPWGNKIGSKQATFIPPKEANSLALHFNGWEKTERLSLTHAQRKNPESEISQRSITFSAEDVY